MTSGNPRRAILATAGHVDHGKTALVRALTGTDTDRLPEEKRRGISIELGFADLPGAGHPVSFIDVPGHRKLVHAMIAGASGVDGLLLCVAADDGVMPQTREHLEVAALLGIVQVIVALTKKDLVDSETLELAEDDVRETLDALGLETADVVATSVVTGEGVDALRRAISTFVAGLAAPRPTAIPWLSVDRVFTVKGAGTIVTGTLSRGRLEVGESIFLHGPNGTQGSVCRGLEVHGHAVGAVDAPSRVAVNLARIETGDVRRGDVVSTDSALPVTNRLDVTLEVVSGFEDAVRDGNPAIVHVGTDRAAGRIHVVEPGLAQLALESPIACLGGIGFVLRGFSADPRRGAVIGGGRVLDARPEPLPSRRNDEKRNARRRELALLRAGAWPGAIHALVDLAAPRPVGGRDIERRLGLEPGVVATWHARGDIAGIRALRDGSFTVDSALDDLRRSARDVVEAHHRAAPHEPGISLETLRTELCRRTSREAIDLVIERAEAAHELVVSSSGVVSTPAFVEARRSDRTAEAERVLDVLESSGLLGVTESDAARLSGLPADAARSTLARLASAESARRLSGLWFSERALDDLRRRVAAHFEGARELTIAAFKDLAAVSRKQAIPLLEQLDREGTTRRSGDTRLAGARVTK